MLEAQIRLEELGLGDRVRWRVELDGPVGRPRPELVEPLVDSDLAAVEGLPRAARTWEGLVQRLSPNEWRIGLRELESVGALIRKRLFGWEKAAEWFTKLEAKAKSEERALRFEIEVDEQSEALWAIPLELAFDGTSFVFKRAGRPAVRSNSLLESIPRIEIQRGDRLLIATAHQDGRAPSEEELREHAKALCEAAERVGLEAEWLENASAETLKKALSPTREKPIDLLYVACHGLEDADHRGQLALRGGGLKGDLLAQWLADHADQRESLKAVILCACSSAATGEGGGTSGMAQWALQRGKAHATVGWRSPVGVSWALRFMEQMFERISDGERLEEAFAGVRADCPNDDPQWVLPLFFTRRLDLSVPSQRMARASVRGLESMVLKSRLPRRPRSYFTAREEELASLRTWLEAPGRAVLHAMAGEGGVGKTELATYVAHEQHEKGMPVIWLDQPDRDLRTQAINLLEVTEPGFRPTPEANTEDLLQRAREALRPHQGLLVLDDVQDGGAVDALVPGGEWNVLVTTRKSGLIPGVAEIPVRPLEPADAVRLLSKVAWGTEAPLQEEAEAAEELVTRLGCLPLAIELAGGTIRREILPVSEYLEGIAKRVGPAATDLERAEQVSARSLETLGEGARDVLMALAVLPSPGARLEMVATVLGKGEPWTGRMLERVVRDHLASFAVETGRYGLHPLMREAMRAAASSDAERWRALHEGVGRAMLGLMHCVEQAIGRSVEESRERWAEVSDLFDALDLSFWEKEDAGGAALAGALARSDMFRALSWSPAQRVTVLDEAERLSRGAAPELRGRALLMRGYPRRYQGDLNGASRDYDEALELHKRVDAPLGKANVLLAQGDLALQQEQMDDALVYYREAQTIYERMGDGLGLSNVLAEMARIHLFKGRSEESRFAAVRAREIGERAQNRYALELSAEVLAELEKKGGAGE